MLQLLFFVLYLDAVLPFHFPRRSVLRGTGYDGYVLRYVFVLVVFCSLPERRNKHPRRFVCEVVPNAVTGDIVNPYLVLCRILIISEAID